MSHSSEQEMTLRTKQGYLEQIVDLMFKLSCARKSVLDNTAVVWRLQRHILQLPDRRRFVYFETYAMHYQDELLLLVKNLQSRF